MPDLNPSSDYIALCQMCFRPIRWQEGVVLGYKYRNGRTLKYVQEELFGDEDTRV